MPPLAIAALVMMVGSLAAFKFVLRYPAADDPYDDLGAVTSEAAAAPTAARDGSRTP